MSSSIRVKIIKITDTQEYGSNGFKKRELVGETGGEHSQELLFEFVNDKTDLLDSLLEGSWVTVHYNLRGRRVERDGKETMWFNSLSGWKVEV